MLIVVLCVSTNSALAYNKDIANIKQSSTTDTMKSTPAYKVGFASSISWNSINQRHTLNMPCLFSAVIKGVYICKISVEFFLGKLSGR